MVKKNALVLLAVHSDDYSLVIAYDTCTMHEQMMEAGMTLLETRGNWFKLFLLFFCQHSLDRYSMSLKEASVISRGIPLRDHLRNENKLTKGE